MKTCFGMAVVAALLISPAIAGEYKAVEPHSCRPSVEKWLETHGHKVEATNAEFGAFAERVIRWDSGTRVVATVGPTSDGRICVIASRFLGSEPAVSAVE